MLQSKTRWMMKECSNDKVQSIASAMNISNLVARLLVNRGIDTVDDARAFLKKDLTGFHDPFLLDSMDLAVTRIEQAIKDQEKILVYGDYDADGVSSTTVLVRALREKGADVNFYIPNRFSEGYGPNEAAFRLAGREGYSVIITVDNGISAEHEAEVARELGIDLIITDHHEFPPQLPRAFAIIHPRKEGNNYPFGELAGVGVAFKLAHALLGEVPKHLLQFAAIGTIADLVPLVGENRLIASLGVQAIQNTNNPGLRSLLQLAGMEDRQVTEETIGFTIGPRINAVGRLGSADPAVELLMTESMEEAEAIATEIDALNQERQQIVTKLTAEAIREVEENFPPEKNNVLVIAKEGWNPGVIGIVASKLVDRFYRPTIILSIDPENGIAKGSARSIEGFDLFQNLSTCRDILPHFGGHAMAAGMTVQLKDVEKLRDRLNSLANEILTADDYSPVTHLDLECSIADVSLDTIEEMIELAPFGVGNPKPIIRMDDLSIKQIRKIGSQNNHLKIIFEQDGEVLDSVGFGLGYLHEQISPLSLVSVIGELSINEWNGFRKPQIMLQDASVNEWQLFDLRGSKDIKNQLQALDQNELAIIAFREETIRRLNMLDWQNRIQLANGQDNKFESNKKFIAILDLPTEAIEIKKLLSENKPERIYAIFNHNEEHFFSTLPTRDHFKWYYSFLMKQRTFNVREYAAVLSSKKGWTKETIHFMTQVFFELEFVKIENDIISLVENPSKKEFSSSKTYRHKQELLRMENELIYSSYQSLKDWFEDIISSARNIEEDVFS